MFLPDPLQNHIVCIVMVDGGHGRAGLVRKIPSAAIAGRDDVAEKKKLLTHLRLVSKRY
jgi:hypothetical protein